MKASTFISVTSLILELLFFPVDVVANMQCAVTMPEGALHYSGTCDHGMANGFGTVHLRHGESYTGSFKDGMLDGKATISIETRPGEFTKFDCLFSGGRLAQEQSDLITCSQGHIDLIVGRAYLASDQAKKDDPFLVKEIEEKLKVETAREEKEKARIEAARAEADERVEREKARLAAAHDAEIKKEAQEYERLRAKASVKFKDSHARNAIDSIYYDCFNIHRQFNGRYVRLFDALTLAAKSHPEIQFVFYSRHDTVYGDSVISNSKSTAVVPGLVISADGTMHGSMFQAWLIEAMCYGATQYGDYSAERLGLKGRPWKTAKEIGIAN